MTTKPGRKLFLNLPVKNLEASKLFFTKLGFEFNAQFSDEKAACMMIGEDSFAMLLSEPFFRTFTEKEICDTTKACEGLFTFSCTSRAEVDQIVKTAVASGGKQAGSPQDHGFMYDWGFYDLDGHGWGAMWMDQPQT